MSLLNYFSRKRKHKSASIANERLRVIISHERAQRNSPEFLPKLQKEIVDVIAKYIAIDKDHVKVQLDHIGDHAVLELNVMVPEKALEEA